jgi:hypothetical protein
MPLFPFDLETGAVQTYNMVLDSNQTTTTSASWANLLTLDADTHGANRYLLLRASFATSDSSSTSGSNQFRLTVDGTVYGYSGAEVFTCIQTGSIVARVGPLAEGDHTVQLDWRTVAGNTLRCRPTTQAEHASIMATEVTA